MRVFHLVVAGSVCLAAAACGLDTNGLGGEEDAGALNEAGSPLDGTLGSEDASGQVNVTSSTETGPTGDDSGGGEDGADVTTSEDASEDGGNDAGGDAGHAGHDSGTDGGQDSQPTDSGADAADAACPGTCTVAAVPTGWSIVEYAESTQPPCSTGYGPSTDVAEGPSGSPATCECTCNPTVPGTCEQGNASVFLNATIGPGCSNTPFANPANDGGCSAVPFGGYTPPGNAMMQIDPPGYSGGSCAPDASVSTTPVTFAAQGRICAGSSIAGACPGNGVCAATPQGFNLCIVHDGTPPCPPGFPNPPHVVGSSGVTDTRGCTTCSCGAADGGCTGQSMTFFTNAGCTTGPETVTANSTCGSFPVSSGPAPKYVGYEYSAEVAGQACPPSPVSPDGGVTLNNPHTVCCQ